MHKRIGNISCIYIKLSVITASLTFSSVFAAETIKRKVLIIDFTNINNSTNYQYLETSIPETFSYSLEKTKYFELLDRNIWRKEVANGKYLKKDSFNQKEVLRLANQYKADVVIIGSFIAMDEQMQTFAKAVEVSSEHPIVASTILAPLDGNMFSFFSRLADEMAMEMKQKLPAIVPATQPGAGSVGVMDYTRAITEINALLDSNLDNNFDKIQELSGKISDSQKNYILNVREKEASIPAAVNGIVGFGIGSFIQGDAIGGLIAMLGEIGSLGIMGGGVVVLKTDIKVGTVIVYTGLGVFLGFKFFEMIRPFVFANNYNIKLIQALKVSFNVTPYLNLAENRNPVYGLALSTRY